MDGPVRLQETPSGYRRLAVTITAGTMIDAIREVARYRRQYPSGEYGTILSPPQKSQDVWMSVGSRWRFEEARLHG